MRTRCCCHYVDNIFTPRNVHSVNWLLCGPDTVYVMWREYFPHVMSTLRTGYCADPIQFTLCGGNTFPTVCPLCELATVQIRYSLRCVEGILSPRNVHSVNWLLCEPNTVYVMWREYFPHVMSTLRTGYCADPIQFTLCGGNTFPTVCPLCELATVQTRCSLRCVEGILSLRKVHSANWLLLSLCGGNTFPTQCPLGGPDTVYITRWKIIFPLDFHSTDPIQLMRWLSG